MKKILLIEDNLKISRVIQLALKMEDYQVSCDVYNDLILPDMKNTLNLTNIRSIMAFPIIFHNSVIGALILRTYRRESPFTKRELKFCTLISNLAAAPLKNAYLFSNLNREKDREQEKRIEAEIKEEASLNLLELIKEASPVPICVFGAEGVITDVNHSYLKELGAGSPREKVVGTNLLQISGDNHYLNFYKKILDGEKPRDEFVHNSVNGDKRTYFFQGAPLLDSQKEIIGGMFTSYDLTEQKKSEEERARLTMAVEQATEAIVISDTKGTISYVNPAFERITGYKREEVIGKNPRLLKSDKHDESFYREMWETLTRGNVWSNHIINKKKDGSLFEADISISPILDTDGKTISYVASQRDKTKEVMLEKQSRQAQKMDSVGTLAGGIAHDFNNILAAIIGYTEMAQDDLPAESPIQQDLANVLEAVDIDADFTALQPTLNPGSWLKLTVGDTGQGMDEETLGRIFDPYLHHQTHR